MKIKNAIGSQVAINNDTRNQRFFVSFCPSTSSAIGFEERFSILITGFAPTRYREVVLTVSK